MVAFRFSKIPLVAVIKRNVPNALECIVKKYIKITDQLKTDSSLAKRHCKARKAVSLDKTENCIVPTIHDIMIFTQLLLLYYLLFHNILIFLSRISK